MNLVLKKMFNIIFFSLFMGTGFILGMDVNYKRCVCKDNIEILDFYGKFLKEKKGSTDIADKMIIGRYLFDAKSLFCEADWHSKINNRISSFQKFTTVQIGICNALDKKLQDINDEELKFIEDAKQEETYNQKLAAEALENAKQKTINNNAHENAWFNNMLFAVGDEEEGREDFLLWLVTEVNKCKEGKIWLK